MHSLEQLHDNHHHNCPCPLKNTATRYVPGVGSSTAQIVLIGEAPGKKEDEGGKPFVGRAGVFLDELLNSIGLMRDDIYITNTVKYRPPDNRDPNPLEKEQCYPWLVDELNFIQPKIIVTLGRHALGTFIPKPDISDLHGTLLHIDHTSTLSTKLLFSLYHPAAALYNGSLRATLFADMQQLAKVLKGL